MGNCHTAGVTNAKGLGLDTMVNGYHVQDGEVTSPRGETLPVFSYRNPTAAEKRYLEANGYHDDLVNINGGRRWLLRPVAVEAVRQQEAMKTALRKNVPGLQELRDARTYDQMQRERFMRSMESGTGVLRGNPRSRTAAELEKQYPVAASYLRAEAWSLAANAEKATLGQAAMKEIARGVSHKSAIKKMERKWKQYIDKHMWD